MSTFPRVAGLPSLRAKDSAKLLTIATGCIVVLFVQPPAAALAIALIIGLVRTAAAAELVYRLFTAGDEFVDDVSASTELDSVGVVALARRATTPLYVLAGSMTTASTLGAMAVVAVAVERRYGPWSITVLALLAAASCLRNVQRGRVRHLRRPIRACTIDVVADPAFWVARLVVFSYLASDAGLFGLFAALIGYTVLARFAERVVDRRLDQELHALYASTNAIADR